MDRDSFSYHLQSIIYCRSTGTWEAVEAVSSTSAYWR